MKEMSRSIDKALSDSKMARKTKGIDMDEISRIIDKYKKDVQVMMVDHIKKLS